jgi:DNA-directed RNA polymerase subunit RPC12/RpoP
MKQSYKCPYCGKEFKSIRILKGHITKTHILYGFYCPYCNITFKTFLSLQSHLSLKNDKLHQNLFHLLTKRHLRYVDKEIFLSD